MNKSARQSRVAPNHNKPQHKQQKKATLKTTTKRTIRTAKKATTAVPTSITHSRLQQQQQQQSQQQQSMRFTTTTTTMKKPKQQSPFSLFPSTSPFTLRKFSTVQTPEVYQGEEGADHGEEGAEERLPFSVADAIKIKEELIDGLKASDSIKAALSHLGTASINSMLKQTQIENIVGQGTLEVIQHLARNGDINLPDIGAGTIAAQNFNTLYTLLQLQDSSGKLKELADEQWCVVMELTFGTDQVITRNVNISSSTAIKIAEQYRNAVAKPSFKKEIAERMLQHPIPPGGNPMQLKLAHELRQMEISDIVSPILCKIYSQYQFDGDEGFCLMKKAMEQYIGNHDVVQLLNEAQRHILESSGLDQQVILENS